MSAPSLQVLTLQAQQIASQIAELRRHMAMWPDLATEVGYLNGAQLLVEQAHSGLRLADPDVRAKALQNLQQMAAVAADPRS